MLAWCCTRISGAEEDKVLHQLATAPLSESSHMAHATCHKGNHSSTWCQLVINSLEEEEEKSQLVRVTGREMAASASVMSSIALKPSSTSPFLERAKGVPSLSRASTPLRVQASKIKKIKTDTPYGTGGGMKLRDGLDASGRKPKGKGVYQFVDKYGANVDGYSPIYDENDWSPSGDVYVGGTTGLLIWAVTLGGLLLGGALLVYNTSALAQ